MKITAPLVTFLSIFACSYLGGVFVEASFDIAQWARGTRIVVAIIGLGLSLYIAGGIVFVRSNL